MSRPLRIEYEGAWYHVMNRGANRRKIFLNLEHFQIFLDILKDVSSLFAAEIHGYCLMNNHYHLLIHTPKANLSRIMRHLNGVYTQRFNKTTKRDGPLFRGRYKALLIEHNAYLLQVSRYIHLNHVEANTTGDPAAYEWSSYSAYVGKKKCPFWLCVNEILKQISGQKAYRDYVMCGVDEKNEKIYRRRHLPAILSGEKFKAKWLETLKYRKVEEYDPDIKRIKHIPTIEKIIEKTAVYFGVSPKDIYISRRGVKNLPRTLSMVICRNVFGYKHREIAACMSKINPASIASNIHRTSRQLDENRKLRKRYELLLDAISKDLTP